MWKLPSLYKHTRAYLIKNLIKYSEQLPLHNLSVFSFLFEALVMAFRVLKYCMVESGEQ